MISIFSDRLANAGSILGKSQPLLFLLFLFLLKSLPFPFLLGLLLWVLCHHVFLLEYEPCLCSIVVGFIENLTLFEHITQEPITLFHAFCQILRRMDDQIQTKSIFNLLADFNGLLHFP